MLKYMLKQGSFWAGIGVSCIVIFTLLASILKLDLPEYYSLIIMLLGLSLILFGATRK